MFKIVAFTLTIFYHYYKGSLIELAISVGVRQGRAALSKTLRGVRMENSSLLGLILRLYWLIAAPSLIIYLTLIRLLVNNEDNVSISIIGTSILLISIIVVRYIDIRFMNGATSEGEKATISDWYYYLKLCLFIIPSGTAIIFLIRYFFL